MDGGTVMLLNMSSLFFLTSFHISLCYLKSVRPFGFTASLYSDQCCDL